MRQSDKKRMKMINPSFVMTLLFIGSWTAQAQPDSHTSIYTTKLIRIVNAMNVGNFETESSYRDMLKTACKRNQCNSQEKQTIQMMAREIVHCRVEHLKSHGIENSDATNICTSKQAMLGCDSLATPLLRKMCYTGNGYNVQVLRMKEAKLKKRLPASQ